MKPLVYITHKADIGETHIHIVRGKEEIIEPLTRNQILNIMAECLKGLREDNEEKPCGGS